MSGRKVFVSSDMSVDERLLLVSEKNGLASLLWPWLLTALDDWGRCKAAPLRLKARVWPMNEMVSVALIMEALDLYAEMGLIERYTVDHHAYLRIPPDRWWKWQTHIHKDKRASDGSRCPAPEGETPREAPRETPRTPALYRASARNRADSRGLARDSVPSPTPSPTQSLTPGREGSGEREHAREQTQAGDGHDAARAADAALALIAPAPAPLAATSSPPSPKVTPLHVPAARTRSVVPDPVWDACIASMGQNGAAPSNRVERGKWAKGIQALKESLAADGSPPSEIVTRARRYRTRFGTSVPLHPMALAGNWTTLATDIQPVRPGQEGQRYGQFSQARSASASHGQYGRSSGGGWSDGRAGKPQVGTPEYYAQAVAEQYGDTGGCAAEG